MAKKEKVVELKPRVEKISEEHLKEIQQAVNSVNKIYFNLGRIEADKHNMLHGLQSSQQNIGFLQDKLQKEYGSFNINLDNGTINWPDENKKEDEK